MYSTIDPDVDEKKLGAKCNSAFDGNTNERVYSILEQQPGQINYTKPNLEDGNERVYSILETEQSPISYPEPSSENGKTDEKNCTAVPDRVYSYLDQDMNESPDYITVLAPKGETMVEPGQPDCSVYAQLSGHRGGENEY